MTHTFIMLATFQVVDLMRTWLGEMSDDNMRAYFTLLGWPAKLNETLDTARGVIENAKSR